jgi:hydroxymethylbilane synthase
MLIVKTSGDIFSQSNELGSAPLGKGMFTKEIEEALLEGRADIAVHSLKDLPTELPEGLVLGATPERADPRDAVIGPAGILDRLRKNAPSVSIGTSSIRRKAQLRAAFPGCRTVDIRGNVDTRLRKVAEGTADCIILAASGLGRVGRDREITSLLDPSLMMPAPAQGVLGVEIRENDRETSAVISQINCGDTLACATAERSFLHRLGSGCRAPVGALATVSGTLLALTGRVISEDGKEIFEGKLTGSADQVEQIGKKLAEKLLADGAGKVLEACRV